MRLIPLFTILSLMSLSFCAQKEAPSPTPTPTPTTPAPTTPVTPPVTDTVKKLVWSDEFNTGSRPDTTKWVYNIGTGSNGWGNNEAQYYTGDSTNARIENGNLIIEARKESKGGKNYTSARMITQGKASWTYGRLEIRAKLPKGVGTWPAIWMLGDNINTVGWPTCGEIDIMEHVGKEQDMVLWSTHSKLNNWSLGTQKTNKATIQGVSDAFHVYKIEWSKDYIQFFVDDKLCYTSPNEGKGSDYYPFNAPQFLLLNLAIGGNLGGPTINDAIFPCRMEVDYVRVYQ
jgi:beta-glucanase (GH16 family)